MVTKPKIILFNNYWGSKGLYKNLKNRYRLISKNWCHQGVIYRNDLFLKHGHYNLKYRVQADHYFNLKALSSLKKDEILKSQKIIAWYSANGFSTRTIDSNFHKDLPNILKDCYGLFFKYILILKKKNLWTCLVFISLNFIQLKSMTEHGERVLQIGTLLALPT